MAELMFGNKEMEREDIIMMADCFSKLLEKCCSNYNHKNLRVKDYDGDRVPFYFGKPNEEIEVMPRDKRIISSKSLSLCFVLANFSVLFVGIRLPTMINLKIVTTLFFPT